MGALGQVGGGAPREQFVRQTAWCYFDHEDDHWGDSPVVVDTNRGIATFYRDGRPALSFEWQLGIYRSGRLAGTTGGVPEEPMYMPADWTPAKDGYR